MASSRKYNRKKSQKRNKRTFRKTLTNNRSKFHTDIECAPLGFANGAASSQPFTSEEKKLMIEEAAEHFGKFLDALKCDWRNDPNSMKTPIRVAKSYVNDLWAGRYNGFTDITSFPNFPSDGYDGIIIERNIPLTSMCSHHHQTIKGVVHIGYVVGTKGRVIGLSILNRIVEHFGRRGAIQEQLTAAIHQGLDKVCEGNMGVITTIVASHNCVSCRGIKHNGSAMITTKTSGVFRDDNQVRKEFFDSLKINNGGHQI
jgi:GTP cyclohydrolase I